MPWWLAGMPPKTDKSKRQVCRSALHLHFAACECQVYANGTTSVTKHNVSRHVVEGKNLVQCCCPTKWLTGVEPVLFITILRATAKLGCGFKCSKKSHRCCTGAPDKHKQTWCHLPSHHNSIMSEDVVLAAAAQTLASLPQSDTNNNTM